LKQCKMYMRFDPKIFEGKLLTSVKNHKSEAIGVIIAEASEDYPIFEIFGPAKLDNSDLIEISAALDNARKWQIEQLKSMGGKEFFDVVGEKMCRKCEDQIIGGSSCSVHFMCEGRYCEQAQELYIEGIDL